MSSPWTGARVAELKKLHTQGLSASRIAELIGGGVTGQAVINKIHRLDLQLDAKVSLETKVQTLRLRARANAKVVPLRQLEAAASDRPGKLLIELGSYECRWPLDDPGPGRMEETRFCGKAGAPLLGGTEPPYCPECRRRNFKKVINRGVGERAAAPAETRRCAS